VVSTGKATLKECQTWYSLEDVYNILEVVMIDAQNRKAIEKAAAARDTRS